MRNEAGQDMINESETYANALLATHREDKKVPWTDLQNCFLNYGRQSADMARRFWKKVEARGEGYKLVGAPNSSDLPKSQWDHLKATSLGLVDGLKGLLRRTPQKIPVENDEYPTRAFTSEDIAKAQKLREQLRMDELTPAQKALIEAVSRAFSIEGLLDAFNVAWSNGVRVYPSNSRPDLLAVREILLDLRSALRGDMKSAVAKWDEVKKQLPAGIRNNFTIDGLPPYSNPTLVRTDRAN